MNVRLYIKLRLGYGTPRSRIITDEKILEAVVAFVTRHGTDKFTFASLAAQVDLSPSTLVQRFGTKQGLLIAAVKQGLHDMESALREARSQHDSPLEAVRSGLVRMSLVVGSKEQFANGQAFFQIALTDESVYATLRASTETVRACIKQLLDEAIAAKELKPCDTDKLALALQAVYEGAITTWIIYQRGRIEAWVKQHVNLIIKPYEVTGGKNE